MWDHNCQRAFDALKEAFVCAPVLAMADPSKPYVLETDASDYALGGVLLQKGDDNKLHPIAYYSKKMTLPEVNYPVYDKELLAIVKAFKHWRRYLCDAAFPV